MIARISEKLHWRHLLCSRTKRWSRILVVMDFRRHRTGKKEQERIANLLSMVPKIGGVALDAGARDGYLSCILANSFESVIALDMEKLYIRHVKIRAVQGDITSLPFVDDCFDLVLCAEVLEHIPQDMLKIACNELARVTKHFLVVGVPYRQDIRIGRTICPFCRGKNPPWGHRNVFDEVRLVHLFQKVTCKRFCFVGETNKRTNFVSTFLMDIAGNPFGTYSQEEPCIFCGSKLAPPKENNFPKKLCTKVAEYLNILQGLISTAKPEWIHILFAKGDD